MGTNIVYGGGDKVKTLMYKNKNSLFIQEMLKWLRERKRERERDRETEPLRYDIL